MDDLATLLLLASSAFFVVLSVSLLVRYSQVSRQIANSTDLGRDLWSALESRLKKQDERVIDMMGKVEVIQTRVLGQHTKTTSLSDVQTSASAGYPRRDVRSENVSHGVTNQSSEIKENGRLDALDSRLGKQDEQLSMLVDQFEAIQSRLNERTQVRLPSARTSPALLEPRDTRPSKVSEPALVRFLGEKPRTSVEIRKVFGVSREHAARLLKGLLDRGFATRNDSAKPFVYDLTDTGRRYLSAT
ncbi:MAG: hypothetical protein HY296_07930 [Thaumarchaeota archaeon]|nr:hypothetical protein [Nitrososphaerota archaeon]